MTYIVDAVCDVCEHVYGDHYDTHDGRWSGCAECGGMVGSCEGFAYPGGWGERE